MFTKEQMENAARFANFCQKIKMKYWYQTKDETERVSEKNLDTILLMAFEELTKTNH